MADDPKTERPPREPRRPRRTPPSAKAAVPPPQDDAPKTPPRGMRKVRESLVGTYTGAAFAVDMIGAARNDAGMRGTAQAVVARAEDAADAWLELAEQNPQVKRALIAFTEGSSVAGLVMVHLMMLAPLLADRGIVPPMFAAMATADPAAAAAAAAAQERNGDSPS